MQKRTMIRICFITTMLLFTFHETYAQKDTVPEKAADYEYMTIVSRQFDSKTSAIYVSTSVGEYQEIKFDILQVKHRFDYNNLLEIISKYNTAGWEVISSNITHIGDTANENFYTYYFLKRRKG